MISYKMNVVIKWRISDDTLVYETALVEFSYFQNPFHLSLKVINNHYFLFPDPSFRYNQIWYAIVPFTNMGMK